jgi:tetratricopeptide (TPR) repeat protein
MRRTPYLRAAAAAAFAVTLAMSPVASAADTSTAESLFEDGLSAMKRDDYKAACEAFAGSNEADPSPGTQINLALCNEKQGKLASAWGWYRTAAGLADQRGQRERADLARAEAAKLEPKLHKVVIDVKDRPPGLSVLRDGVPVPTATLGRELPLDPGEHVIEVSAPGKKPWTHTVTIPPGPGMDRIDVPALEDAPAEAAPAGPGAGEYRPPDGTEGGGSTQRTVGFVVGGAGIAALATAGGLQVLAVVVKSDARRLDDAKLDSSSKHKAASANQLAAQIIAAGGLALVGTGIVLLVTAKSSKPTGSARPWVLPLLGSGTAGMAAGGSF